jgi:hypothetical protein
MSRTVALEVSLTRPTNRGGGLPRYRCKSLHRLAYAVSAVVSVDDNCAHQPLSRIEPTGATHLPRCPRA